MAIILLANLKRYHSKTIYIAISFLNCVTRKYFHSTRKKDFVPLEYCRETMHSSFKSFKKWNTFEEKRHDINNKEKNGTIFFYSLVILSRIAVFVIVAIVVTEEIAIAAIVVLGLSSSFSRCDRNDIVTLLKNSNINK